MLSDSDCQLTDRRQHIMLEEETKGRFVSVRGQVNTSTVCMRIMGSIYSMGKFEGVFNALCIQTNSVHDIIHLLKLDVLQQKADTEGYCKHDQCTEFSALHPVDGGSLITNEEDSILSGWDHFSISPRPTPLPPLPSTNMTVYHVILLCHTTSKVLSVSSTLALLPWKLHLPCYPSVSHKQSAFTY